MAERLLNKIAVVTGASGAFGRAIVQRFLAEGAKVVVFARNRGRLEELAGMAPARIVVVAGDVTSGGNLEELVDTTVRRFGGVDVLVPAAGVVRRASLEQSTTESLAELFAVNCDAAIQTLRAFRRHLNSGASIVFLSAGPGLAAFPDLGGFAASKAALATFAKSVSAELLSRRIRVNCVAPGAAAWGPPDRSKSAEVLPWGSDVAEAVLFLASDGASHIVGQEIVVDRPPIGL